MFYFRWMVPVLPLVGSRPSIDYELLREDDQMRETTEQGEIVRGYRPSEECRPLDRCSWRFEICF
jgi:hypothetical protein